MKIIKAFFLLTIFLVPFLSYAGGVSIVVKKGDTLYSISRRYKVPVTQLARYNNLDDPSRLKTGMIIKIPSFYTVKKGDTLYGISKSFGLTVAELCRINEITINHLLKVGEQLQVPMKKSVIQDKSESKAPVAVKPDEKSTSADGSGLLWPHNGKRVAINGKIKGEEIFGNKGDIIVSVSSGKVVWVAPYRSYGTLIMIEGRDKHIFAYGGNEETLVKVGDLVTPGMSIGRMGIDPIEKDAKAYFFVYKNGKPVDPSKAPRG